MIRSIEDIEEWWLDLWHYYVYQAVVVFLKLYILVKLKEIMEVYKDELG